MKIANKKNLILISLLTLVLAIAMLFCVSGQFESKKTYAEGAITAKSSDFYMGGSSIQLKKETAAGYGGIRFRVLMSKTLYDTLYTDGVANEGVSTGILLVPKAYVKGELTRKTASVSVSDVTDFWVESLTEEGYMENYVFLYNQPEKSYSRTMCARAYYENNGQTIYTADTCERDISRVALKIYNDNDDEYIRNEIRPYIDATISMHVDNVGNVTVHNDVDDELNYVYTEGAAYKSKNHVTAQMQEGTAKQIKFGEIHENNILLSCDTGVTLDKSSLSSSDGEMTFNVRGVAKEKPVKQVSKAELSMTGGYQIDLSHEGLNTENSMGVSTLSYVTSVPNEDTSGLNTYLYYKGDKTQGNRLALSSYKDVFEEGYTYYVEFTVFQYGLNLPEPSSASDYLLLLCMNEANNQVGAAESLLYKDNMYAIAGSNTRTYYAQFTAPANMSYPIIYVASKTGGAVVQSGDPSFYLKSIRIMKYEKNSYYVQNGSLKFEKHINGKEDNATIDYNVYPTVNGHNLTGSFYRITLTDVDSAVVISSLNNKFTLGKTYSIVIKGYGTFERNTLNILALKTLNSPHIHGGAVSALGSVMLTEMVNKKPVDRKYFELTLTFTASTEALTPNYILLYAGGGGKNLDAYIHSVEVNEFSDTRTAVNVTSTANTESLEVDFTTQKLDMGVSLGLNTMYYDVASDGTILTRFNRTTAVWDDAGHAYAGTMLYLTAFNEVTLSAQNKYKLTITSTFIADADKLNLSQGSSSTVLLSNDVKVREVGTRYGETIYEYSVFFVPLSTVGTYLKLVNSTQQAGASMPYTIYGMKIENVASATDGRADLTTIDESVICSENGYVSNFSKEKFVINDARVSHVRTAGTTVNGINCQDDTDSTWLLKVNLGTGGGILSLNQFDQAIKQNLSAGEDVAYTLTISCWTTINPSGLYLMQCNSVGGQSQVSPKWSGSSACIAYYIHQDELDNGKMIIKFAFDTVSDFDHLGLWLSSSSSEFIMYIDEIRFDGLKMVDNEFDSTITKIVYPNVYDSYGFFANAQSVMILDKGKVVLFDGGEIDAHATRSLKRSWYTLFTIEYTLRYYGVTTIDAMILSHPHSDHLGYLIPAMEKFEVKNFYYKWFSDNPDTGETADGYKNGTTSVANPAHPDNGFGMNNDIQNLLTACDTNGVPKNMVTFGQVVTLNNQEGYKSQLTFYFDQMIYGPKNGAVNENTYSLTCMYTVNGRNVMYLTGDNMDNEQHFIDSYGWSEAEAKAGPGAIIDAVDDCIIYQLSHHGDTGAYNSLRLIEQLDAEWGIVCAPDYEKFRFPYNRPCLDLVERLVGNGMEREKIIAPLGDGLVFNVITEGTLVMVEKEG